MNNKEQLQAKAEELIALSETYGLKAKISLASGLAVWVDYNNHLHSVVSFTDTGKVSVKSYDRVGGRTENVSLKNLPDYLKFYRA